MYYHDDSNNMIVQNYERTGLLSNMTENPICIDGRAVPRLYILGHQKCATTTTALALYAAGVSSASQPALKELHSFDSFYKGSAGGTESRYPTGSAEELKKSFLKSNNWLQCRDGAYVTLMDATPANVKLPDLPAHMSSLYGSHANKLAFVIHLRDPLGRLQSAWYMKKRNRGEFQNQKFGGWMKSIKQTMIKYNKTDFKDIETDETMDIVYRSLYYKNIVKWFREFEYGQFLIVPLKYFTASLENQQITAQILVDKFRVTAVPSMFDLDTGYSNAAADVGVKPPSVEDDMGRFEKQFWNTNFFKPQLYKLSQECATRGIAISGYMRNGGVSGSADGIYHYLKEFI